MALGEGEQVVRARVLGIPLDRLGDVLLLDEHHLADRQRLEELGLVLRLRDDELAVGGGRHSAPEPTASDCRSNPWVSQRPCGRSVRNDMRTDRVRVDAHARPRCTAADGGPDRGTSRACVSLRTGTARTLFSTVRHAARSCATTEDRTVSRPAPRRFTEALRARVPRPAGRHPRAAAAGSREPRGARPRRCTARGVQRIGAAWPGPGGDGRLGATPHRGRGGRVRAGFGPSRRPGDGAAPGRAANGESSGRERAAVSPAGRSPAGARGGLGGTFFTGRGGRFRSRQEPPVPPLRHRSRSSGSNGRWRSWSASSASSGAGGQPWRSRCTAALPAGSSSSASHPARSRFRLSSARPPSTDALGELRQALEARGLSVRSLETRSVTASAADACSPCP